ncbi:MAG: hypothetical protein KJ718_04665 [Nanoarchaeota archaeon]|nr:hypothetical protein [Nanoarchaeota archaeon]MBU1051819.1 hypothetical protein [Nanoarchaeota archaeon]MBU1988849.1 hypothetical protein [Nanoarchaeota archaeon]
MARLKPERNWFEKVVGKVMMADWMLGFVSNRLRENVDELVYFNFWDGSYEREALLERAEKRYMKNRRSRFYRFANPEVQRKYDEKWHCLGRIVKEDHCSVYVRTGRLVS